MSGVAAILDRLPTWVKATLWLALAAVIDGVANAVLTGQVKVDPVWIPFINVAIVALRDFIRARQEA